MLGGLIAGLVLVVLVIMFTSGDDDSVAVTTSPSTSVAADTSTTAAPAATTTTSSSSTTTTTTTPGWPETRQNATPTGTPGPHLTDVRVGDHETHTRIVFDFTGDGIPMWTVGYAAGPSFTGSGGGDPIVVDGAAFLEVRVFPGVIHDFDTNALTYPGPTSFDPGLGPITEIAFIDDFEADMVWVIGLEGVRAFSVESLTGPVRLVIDIEH